MEILNYDDEGWDNLVISPVNDIRFNQKMFWIKLTNLKKYITVNRDGTKKEILKAFQRTFLNITTGNDYVLIYYSGHGRD